LLIKRIKGKEEASEKWDGGLPPWAQLTVRGGYSLRKRYNNVRTLSPKPRGGGGGGELRVPLIGRNGRGVVKPKSSIVGFRAL